MYQIVHMHINICRHTHAVETSFYSNVFFHYSKQVSAPYAQQKYLHWTEKKIFLQKTVQFFSISMPHILRTLHTNLKTPTQWAKPLNSSAKWNFTLKTM